MNLTTSTEIIIISNCSRKTVPGAKVPELAGAEAPAAGAAAGGFPPAGVAGAAPAAGGVGGTGGIGGDGGAGTAARIGAAGSSPAMPSMPPIPAAAPPRLPLAPRPFGVPGVVPGL